MFAFVGKWQYFITTQFKFGLVLLFVFMTGCSTVNEKVGGALNFDTDLKLQVIASSSVNPDETDRASPVYLRLYQLSDPKAFENASFLDLYEKDKEVLADTFISKQELKRITPDSTRVERFVLTKGTRYVAVFAEFFKYKEARAKVVFPVTSSNVIRDSVKINISGNTMTLSK